MRPPYLPDFVAVGSSYFNDPFIPIVATVDRDTWDSPHRRIPPPARSRNVSPILIRDRLDFLSLEECKKIVSDSSLTRYHQKRPVQLYFEINFHQQFQRLFLEGYPEASGLYMGGVLVRFIACEYNDQGTPTPLMYHYNSFSHRMLNPDLNKEGWNVWQDHNFLVLLRNAIQETWPDSFPHLTKYKPKNMRKKLITRFPEQLLEY